MLWVTGDPQADREVYVSEATATFLEIVGPMRREFALDPRTGELLRRRPGRLLRLLSGLVVLGCVQGHALLTPAVTGIDAGDGRPQPN